jgi:predicted AAA+ superfamily ATPase
MPHSRTRIILPRLLKKLSFFPVVAIQGARQTGKSFLAHSLLKDALPLIKYLSFDQLTVRQQAKRAPQTFLTDHSESMLLVIDEAQKVPEIFDAVKFEVDQRRVPGRFLLLGSTEFSKLSQIRESLTGRMGRIRLFPLTVKETLGSKSDQYSMKQLLHYLRYGGMPGFFAVRDEDERASLIQDWIDLICLRDMHQFKGVNTDSDLSYAILKLCCQLDEPTKPAISKKTNVDPRRVESHLKCLCELFVLQKINPHPSGKGKPIYLPLDAGIAEFLGAPLLRRLHIWLMNERLALDSFGANKRKEFFYYRSQGKKWIHWVEESINGEVKAFQIIDHENIKKTDAELFLAFKTKNPGAKGGVLAPIPEKMKVNGNIFQPWHLVSEL